MHLKRNKAHMNTYLRISKEESKFISFNLISNINVSLALIYPKRGKTCSQSGMENDSIRKHKPSM